jgi:hypothetical protein
MKISAALSLLASVLPASAWSLRSLFQGENPQRQLAASMDPEIVQFALNLEASNARLIRCFLACARLGLCVVLRNRNAFALEELAQTSLSAFRPAVHAAN